jgi:hypothetical protein
VSCVEVIIQDIDTRKEELSIMKLSLKVLPEGNPSNHKIMMRNSPPQLYQRISHIKKKLAS